MTVPNFATRPVSLRASRKVGTNRLFLASSARLAHPHSLTRTRSRAIVSAASSCVIWHTQHVTCARTLTRAPHACHHTSRRYSPPQFPLESSLFLSIHARSADIHALFCAQARHSQNQPPCQTHIQINSFMYCSRKGKLAQIFLSLGFPLVPSGSLCLHSAHTQSSRCLCPR